MRLYYPLLCAFEEKMQSLSSTLSLYYNDSSCIYNKRQIDII